jgi:transcriptional regulator GlxA family with amidase domain
MKMKNINVILFDNFTILDAMGPVEVFRCLDKIYKIDFYSIDGKDITTNSNLCIKTKPFSDILSYDLVIIPGGVGTRSLINDQVFIDKLKNICKESEYVLSICTGSALLAKTELLNDKKATSNKMSFNWVIEQNKEVNWQKKARWVVDGKYYTSSGITAGIDMALGFVKDKISEESARKIAMALEYIWNENSEDDKFEIK